jgi:hypothetical protein
MTPRSAGFQIVSLNFCHSERSEESSGGLPSNSATPKWILRSAQNDKPNLKTRLDSPYGRRGGFDLPRFLVSCAPMGAMEASLKPAEFLRLFVANPSESSALG